MKNIIKKILKWIGIAFLWIAISGAYDILVITGSIFETLVSIWLVFLIGLILHRIGSKGLYKSSDNILEVIATMISLRGIFGIVFHFFRPLSLWSTITYSLVYGIIFFIIGSIGMYSLNRIWTKTYEKKILEEMAKEIEPASFYNNRKMRDLLLDTIKLFEVFSYISKTSNIMDEAIEKIDEINDSIRIYHRGGILYIDYDDIEVTDGGSVTIGSFLYIKLKNNSSIQFKTYKPMNTKLERKHSYENSNLH